MAHKDIRNFQVHEAHTLGTLVFHSRPPPMSPASSWLAQAAASICPPA